MSRTIFAGVLAAGLLFAVGCGSKPAPTLPGEKLDPAPGPGPAPPTPGTDPGAGAPKVELPPVVWELDADKHAIPPGPVRGRISGAEVTPDVLVTGEEVTFRVLKAGTQTAERSVSIKLAPLVPGKPPGPSILGRAWKVKGGDGGPTVPEVWQEVQGQPILLHPGGYALTLELGARKDGKVSGTVYLSLPDKDQSVLAGAFTTDYFRPHMEPPGPDDAPYVKGAVTVAGAKSDAAVRVAYAGFTPAGVLFKELQLALDPASEEEARWVPDDTDRPRASRLVAGDGKARPSRYEHTRLPPGRYLLSAGVAGGPAVWKWVEVAAGGTPTEDFSLDVTKTGGVEVSVPPETKGKAVVAPADAPDRPALDAELFRAIAFQVVRQDADVVGGKATIKNLAPGRYEVRAGDLRGFVDVVAGKTAELTLK